MTGQTATDQSMDSDGHELPQSRSRTRFWLLGVGLAAVLVAGSGYLLVSQHGTAEATDDSHAELPTATVVRETISDSRSFSGTLGHGAALTVATAGNGVITGLADTGTEVERGDELFRLNEQPATALYGDIPMYRDLRSGNSGLDVIQLIENLTALGYADCGDVDWYSWCVESAVRDWQDDLGVSETGSLSQPDVVFVPEGTRVDAVHTEIGGLVAPGSPVLDLTGVEQVVSLEIPVRDREVLAAGAEVTVALPGGAALPGAVTDARAVQVDQDDDTIIAVEVTLAEEADAALLGATAEVVVELGQREGVLTAPVNALLALAGGGHGVEVVAADGTTTLVPVETGLFAAGRVEVSGEGITEGTVVGVAGR